MDVIVVGAGLAGLRCAGLLQSAGLDVTVLESADRIGGRVATDVVDGFLVDRGFQVLNPAYPALAGSVDLAALRMQPYDAGVLVRTTDGLRTLAHPVRAPRELRHTLSSGLLGVRDVVGLLRWLTPVLAAPQRSLRARDRAWGAALDELRVTGDLRTVLDRFLAGVLVESRGQTSARLVRLLLRSFVLGSPGVPRDGMQALPAQLAAPLRDVRLNTRVESVAPDPEHPSVVADGQRLAARAVVVAADASAARALVDLPPSATRGLVTWWFAAEAPPTGSRMLAVDARGGAGSPQARSGTPGSRATPPRRTRPPGGTSCTPRRCSTGPTVRRPRQRYAGTSARSTAATPTRGRWSFGTGSSRSATPPGTPVRRPVALGDGVFVCGDHRDTAFDPGRPGVGPPRCRRGTPHPGLGSLRLDHRRRTTDSGVSPGR